MRHVDLKLLYNVSARKGFINKLRAEIVYLKRYCSGQRSWCAGSIIEHLSGVRYRSDGTSLQNSAANAAAAAELMTGA